MRSRSSWSPTTTTTTRTTPAGGSRPARSSGAISAAVVVMQNWLSRVRRRRLEVTIDEDGRKNRYLVDGSSASDETLKAVLIAALESARRDG